MMQICQTVSGESKFASMSEQYHQNLEKMQTASAQAIKIFGESNKFTRISETASRKFNLLYYASLLPLTLYHYSISQTVSAESEPIFKEPRLNKSIYINNELKRTRTNSNCMSSFQFVPVRCLNYLRNRTRMTRITRIFTDTVNPRASVSSAQSVFHPKNPVNLASAFICVHPRLNRMALPVDGELSDGGAGGDINPNQQT